MPDWAVPSHQASTSSLATPADSSVSVTASTSRSSVPRSQCSLKGVHPMPMIATWSLMPWLAMSAAPLVAGPAAHRAGLPEVVRDAVRGVEAAERHLDRHPDRHVVGSHV